MLVKCPFCDRKHDGQLRCQQCQQRLTEWLNWDNYAQEAQASAAVLGPAAAINSLERATVFDPDSPNRFAELGHALVEAQLPLRASVVLQYAQDRFPDSVEIAELATRLQAPEVSGPEEVNS